jgi:peptidoglycan/xylan/chitin deacetylase (PgdA/CDA1 family)
LNGDANTEDVLVLCYHAVSDTWSTSLAISAERLERQLALLLDRSYRGATFTQAVTDPPADRTLAVTFDDGFGSVFERALPVLTRLGITASVFVPSGFVGADRPMTWPGVHGWVGGAHEEELAPMTWGELSSLAERGWEIGSHSRTHPRLTMLDDETLADELRASREECAERLGKPCVSLAYPYGDMDERVIDAAARAGYRTAAGLPARLHDAMALNWPRVGIYGNDSFERFIDKVTPHTRAAIDL